MTEAVSWYRQEMKREEREYDFKREKGSWKLCREERKRNKQKKHNIRKLKRGETLEKDILREESEKYQTVMFIEYTEGSELARRIRDKLEKIEKVGRLKVKIVERAGDKIVDLLHRSNPWNDADCKRKDCLICESTGENERKGKCKKRGVVYETYCKTCGLITEDTEEEEK